MYYIKYKIRFVSMQFEDNLFITLVLSEFKWSNYPEKECDFWVIHLSRGELCIDWYSKWAETFSGILLYIYS